MTDEDPSVCVVTQPGLSESGPMESQALSLCRILETFAAVSLISLNIGEESQLRDEYQVYDAASSGAMPESIVGAALQFAVNQIRLGLAIRRFDADVALFYGCTSYVLPMAIARLSGIDVIAIPKGDVAEACRQQWAESVPDPMARALAGVVRTMERMGFAVATGVATYTPGMAQSLGLEPANADVYPDAARFVETDRFSLQREIEDRPDRVVFVGRLDAEKNVDVIADVAVSMPDVEFVFVGDGPQRDRLEIAASNITVEGWQPHDRIPEYLNDARALVLASDPTEGLPTVILEAFACGTPVVATDVAGVSDVVSDDLTGYLVAEPDPAALQSALRELVHHEDLPSFSENCSRLVDIQFSFDAAVERYATMFAKMTAASVTAPTREVPTAGVDAETALAEDGPRPTTEASGRL